MAEKEGNPFGNFLGVEAPEDVEEEVNRRRRKELGLLAQHDGGMSPFAFFWIMFFFHYFDVFFFINMGGLFRLFIYAFLAVVFLPFVYYKSESGQAKISACTPIWVLLGITFFLPYITVLPVIDKIPGVYSFLTNFAGIILIWFPPIPLYLLFTSQLGDFGNKAIIALIVFWLVCAFAGIGPMQNSQYFKDSFLARMPSVNIWGGVKSMPERFKEGVDAVSTSFRWSPAEWYQRQMQIAAGDYYVGVVDENEGKKVGVFIEETIASERSYLPSESVKVWSTVSAQTMDGEPIDIETACRTDEYLGSINPDHINIGNTEKRDLLCTFPSDTFESGEEEISVYAKFNFFTLAYLKAYFMDKERQRAYTRDNLDPLDEYGITDKNPRSVFTNGPIQIGMDTTQPLLGLFRDAENPDFKLGMTIKNNWFGTVVNITSLEIQLPNTMSIVPDSCDQSVLLGDSSVALLSREYSSPDYVIYHIDEAALENIESFDDFETINCKLIVDDVDGTLGDTPITTKYFRVMVAYTYQLEDMITVEIENEDS